jgi:hypothetical protein
MYIADLADEKGMIPRLREKRGCEQRSQRQTDASIRAYSRSTPP